MGPPALLLCWTYLWPSVFLAQQVCVEKSHLPLALVGEAPHQLPVAHVVKLLPVLLSFTAFLIPTDCLHTEIAKHCLRMKCTDRGAVAHWGSRICLHGSCSFQIIDSPVCPKIPSAAFTQEILGCTVILVSASLTCHRVSHSWKLCI